MTPRAVFRTSALSAIAAVTLFAGAAVPALATPGQPAADADAAPDLTVTNGNDSGAGSLRAALEQANADPDETTIGFAPAVTTVSLDTPLRSTGALSILGAGVTLRASDDWHIIADEPGGPPAPDVLLHAERSSLTVSGITLDAAQTAMAALYADATGEQDTITVRESTLRNPSDLALIVSDASGQITVQNSRIEQENPDNRAVGIHAMSSAGAGFLIADTSVSGFGHGAAEFVEWYRPDDATAQIRFERASLTGNGNASEENWTAAGGISLSQPSNVPVDPRLVVVDSTLSENVGRYAGGIAVSAASWGSAPGARVVEISGSTFSHNTSTADPGNPWMPSADDLMEMPLPSRAAAAAAPSPAPEHPFLADLAAEGHLEL
ncbi:hypothetical protein, partial [Leucobacter sp. M11]|uniref:hypothetical protein n=1 Tax=Leucobacter sp. M11 TaxID=2993565 RepID=UPI002D8056E4